VKSGNFAAIILAAGFSSRIHTFKPLLMLDGVTFTDRVISTYKQNGIEVYLVTGYQNERLLSSIKNQDIHIIYNPDYNRGMLSSIQAGIRNLPSDTCSFFITPVDIPLVRTFTIKRIIEKAKEFPGKIVYPEFERKRGHPTLIPMEIKPVILNWKKEGGLRAVLDDYEEMALEVAVADRYIHFDIDTVDDYKVLLEGFADYDVPTGEECEVILTSIAKVSPEVRRHCIKVAEVADDIGQAISASFVNLDLGAIRSGSMLHDILKGRRDHAAAGGLWLSEMGFAGIAEIVAAHTDLPAGVRGSSLEDKVVFLADKYIREDAIVSLEDRFKFAVQRFGSDPRVRATILRRRKMAFDVKDEIERLLRRLLDGVISIY